MAVSDRMVPGVVVLFTLTIIFTSAPVKLLNSRPTVGILHDTVFPLIEHADPGPFMSEQPPGIQLTIP